MKITYVGLNAGHHRCENANRNELFHVALCTLKSPVLTCRRASLCRVW